MKATFDLPDELLKRIKLRAIREGRKLKETVTDLLIAALASSSAEAGSASRPRADIVKDRKTGLTVIRCPRRPSARQVAPERIAQILADQEAEWARESG